MKNAGINGTINDESDLKDIQNVKGDETFTQNGDDVQWSAGSNDIYYQGTTDKELPVGVEIKYELDGKEIAANILTPLVKATGLANRGLSERPNLVVLKRTVMPAVLVECAFVTCEKDRAVLMNDAKVSQIADAICEGIITSLRTMKKIK